MFELLSSELTSVVGGRDASLGIDGFSALETLEQLARARAVRAVAEATELALAAHWADLHGSLDTAVDGGRMLPGAERLIELGGAGTPAVAEFCPAELGAELGMSPAAASALIADALDTRHRLPCLWGRVMTGEVAAWTARRVAQQTRHLSEEAARLVDAKVARWSSRLTWARLSKVVEAAVIEADPEGATIAVEVAGDNHGVWVNPASEGLGTGTAFIRADAASLTWFDATVDTVAADLKALGDDGTHDSRRARAIGVLAHPQHTLDLHYEADNARAVTRANGADQRGTAVQGHIVDRAPATMLGHTGDCAPVFESHLQKAPALAAGRGPLGNPAVTSPDAARTTDAESAAPSARPATPRGAWPSAPRATLYVHLSAADLKGEAGGTGVARAESSGPSRLIKRVSG